MSNDYYTAGAVPGTSAAGSSAVVRGEYLAVEAGFNKLATLTGAGNRIPYINSGATAQTTNSGFTFDGTTFTAPALAVTNNSVLTGDLAVNGGDFTSSATTFNLLNATVTTLNVGGAATAVNIGAATGTTTVVNALAGTIATDSTSTTTGAWKTAGGLGIAKALWVGGLANIAGTLTAAAINASDSVTGTRANSTFVANPTTSAAILGHFEIKRSGTPYGYVGLNASDKPSLIDSAGVERLQWNTSGASVTGTLGVTGTLTAAAANFSSTVTFGSEGNISQNGSGIDIVPANGRSLRVLDDTSSTVQFSVAEGTGNTFVGGTLGVTGGSTLTGIVGIGGAASNGGGYDAFGQVVGSANAAFSLKKTAATAQEWIADVVAGGGLRLRDVTAGTVPLAIAASTGAVTLTGALTVGNFYISSSTIYDTAATTSHKSIRVASTGGDFYFGIESSSAGGFFTGTNAYESVLYSQNNVIYARTPGLRIEGTLTVVGHGTTASAANAYIDSGTGLISRSTSSLRYKTDVEPASSDLADAVMKLTPIWYRSLSPNDRSDWSFYGLAAEEVAEIDPRFVHWVYSGTKEVLAREATEEEEAVYKTVPDTDSPLIPDAVQYERLVVPLILKVQQLTAEFQAHKAAHP